VERLGTACVLDGQLQIFRRNRNGLIMAAYFLAADEYFIFILLSVKIRFYLFFQTEERHDLLRDLEREIVAVYLRRDYRCVPDDCNIVVDALEPSVVWKCPVNVALPVLAAQKT
jgi:hypothetical protein